MTDRLRLPGLLSADLFDILEEVTSRDFQLSSTYPYNVITTYDEEGVVTGNILEFAFAGFSKDAISVKIVDEQLQIEAKEDFPTPKTWSYTHRGISKRSFKTSLALSPVADVENVKSQYKNGLLLVTIPIKEKEVTNIDIQIID